MHSGAITFAARHRVAITQDSRFGQGNGSRG
jgi:hypothetical protein